jgi:hypothetical protein
VLRPNGILVLSVETDGINWFTKWLRRSGLHEECWVEPWGHIGLIRPGITVEMVEKYFIISELEKTSTWLPTLDSVMPMQAHIRFLRLFNSDLIRRFANVILYLPFRFSLVFSSLDGANDLLMVARPR